MHVHFTVSLNCCLFFVVVFFFFCFVLFLFFFFLFFVFQFFHIFNLEFLHGSEFVVGTLWAQLLLQFYTDPSETSQAS